MNFVIWWIGELVSSVYDTVPIAFALESLKHLRFGVSNFNFYTLKWELPLKNKTLFKQYSVAL